MTHIYQRFSFPKIFSVICPKCNKESSCLETQITQINANGIKTTYNSGKLNENKGGFQVKLNCIHCGYNKEKNVQCPKEAYWKFNIKGEVLWAWSLEHTKAILKYILSKEIETIYIGCFVFKLNCVKIQVNLQLFFYICYCKIGKL